MAQEQVPRMTAMDHIREAERFIFRPAGIRPSELELRLAELHLKAADSINQCVTSDRANAAQSTMLSLFKGMPGMPGEEPA